MLSVKNRDGGRQIAMVIERKTGQRHGKRRGNIPPPSRQGSGSDGTSRARDPKWVRRSKYTAISCTGLPPVGCGVDYRVPIGDKFGSEVALI
jgi:hypothetical protein